MCTLEIARSRVRDAELSRSHKNKINMRGRLSYRRREREGKLLPYCRGRHWNFTSFAQHYA
jgi:hypothetical protein